MEDLNLCNICKRIGHYASECWFRNTSSEEEVHLVKEEKSTILLACNDLISNQGSMWYLDICASNHMCGKKKLFVEIDESYNDNIVFGDLSKRPVKGKWKILITSTDGGQQLISDVYYIPRLKSNILSLGQLFEKGYEIQMKDLGLCIRDKNENLVTCVRMTKNRMFPLNLKID